MKKFITFLLLFFSIISTGCQKKDMNTKNKLNICFNMDPKTLDARKSGDIVTSAMLFLLFNGLTEIDKDGSIIPSLAESYTISKDKKTYIFNIRKEAKWSDGKKITAYDFEKSWKKAIDPSFPSLCPQLFYPIKNAEKAARGKCSLDEVGIMALDDNTLVVNLQNPTPYFLSLTSFCVYFPVPSHIDENLLDDDKYINNDMVVSGPFKLLNWKKNSAITLAKNDTYWNKDTVHLKNINIAIVKDENTALQMYENNEIDFVGALLSPLPIDAIENIVKRKDCNLSPIGGTTFCVFNTEKYPFTNKNIRKALGLAIDRKKIVENITQAEETVATRCIPPMLCKISLDFYNDNDTVKANEYLEKGLKELKLKKNELKITFSYGSNIIHKKIAETLKDQWEKALSINVNIKQEEEKTMMDKFHKKDVEAGLAYWLIQYNDPMNIFDRFKYKHISKNYPQFENQQYIDHLDYSMGISDPIQREQVLNKAEEIFLDEMPIAPIYHHNYIILNKPHVKNLFVGQVGEVRFDKIKLK